MICTACKRAIDDTATICPMCQAHILTIPGERRSILSATMGIMLGAFGGAWIALFVDVICWWNWGWVPYLIQISAAIGAVLCGLFGYYEGFSTKESRHPHREYQ